MNSGTKATMAAVRIARAATGKEAESRSSKEVARLERFPDVQHDHQDGGDVRAPLTVPNSWDYPGVQQDIVGAALQQRLQRSSVSERRPTASHVRDRGGGAGVGWMPCRRACVSDPAPAGVS